MGATVFLCGHGVRCRDHCTVPGCFRPYVALCDCDYPIRRDGAAATCDAKLCQSHRVHQLDGSGHDYCPPHNKFARNQAQA